MEMKLVFSLWLFVTPWTAACQAPLSITNSRSLLKHVQLITNSKWVGDVIQPSHPLLSPLLLASIFYSIKVFPIESALSIRWPKYWSFSFSISPSNEYSELVSFRIDRFDLLQELSIASVQTGWGAFMAKPWRRVELSGWRGGKV